MNKSERPKGPERAHRARFANRESALRALVDLRSFFFEHRMRDAHAVVDALEKGMREDPKSLELLANAARVALRIHGGVNPSWDGPTEPFARPEYERFDVGRVLRDGIRDMLADAAQSDGDPDRTEAAADSAARWVSAILFDEPLGHGLRDGLQRAEDADERASSAARKTLGAVDPAKWHELETVDTLVRECLRAYGVKSNVVNDLFQ